MARHSKPPIRVTRAKHVVGRGYGHHGHLTGVRLSGAISKPESNVVKKDVYGVFSPFVKWFHDNVATVFEKGKPVVDKAMSLAVDAVNAFPGVKDLGDGLSNRNYGQALKGLALGVGNQLVGPLIQYYGVPFVEEAFMRYINEIRNRRRFVPVDVELPWSTGRLLVDDPFARTGLSHAELYQLGFVDYPPVSSSNYGSNAELLRGVRSLDPRTYGQPGGYVYSPSELRRRVRT